MKTINYIEVEITEEDLIDLVTNHLKEKGIQLEKGINFNIKEGSGGGYPGDEYFPPKLITTIVRGIKEN